MTYDASNRKQVRAAEKAARQAEVRRAEVLRQIASTGPGREWLWEQLGRSHIFTTPFSDDPYRTAFNLGEQNAGLRLLSDMMENCPEEFINAMREANERRTRTEQQLANTDAESDTDSGAATAE